MAEEQVDEYCRRLEAFFNSHYRKTFYIPKDLGHVLAISAKSNGRSINRELVKVLEDYYYPLNGKMKPEVYDRICRCQLELRAVKAARGYL